MLEGTREVCGMRKLGDAGVQGNVISAQARKAGYNKYYNPES